MEKASTASLLNHSHWHSHKWLPIKMHAPGNALQLGILEQWFAWRNPLLIRSNNWQVRRRPHTLFKLIQMSLLQIQIPLWDHVSSITLRCNRQQRHIELAVSRTSALSPFQRPSTSEASFGSHLILWYSRRKQLRKLRCCVHARNSRSSCPKLH